MKPVLALTLLLCSVAWGQGQPGFCVPPNPIVTIRFHTSTSCTRPDPWNCPPVALVFEAIQPIEVAYEQEPKPDPNLYRPPVTICGDACLAQINPPDPLQEIGKLTRVLNEQQSVIQTQQEQINDLQEKVKELTEAVEELQKAKDLAGAIQELQKLVTK